MKKESGVTLLEVLSCIAIIGVLTGISAPITENLKSRIELHEEILKLSGELHRARSFAIKSNSHVAFCYTKTGYKFFIDDGHDEGIKEDWIQQPGEHVLADVTLGNRLAIALEESSFSSHRTRFSRSPSVKPGAIVMQGSDGNKRKVIVNAIGRIRVEKI